MKVFLSWSGDMSKELAEALRDWLPAVLQAVRPYFTPDDVEKGARWIPEIAQELELSEVGIMCLTRESLSSSWVMFEAGALAKMLDKSRVCPLLFGIESSDVKGPLVQFQATPFSKTEVRKLVRTLNELCGEHKLADNVRESVFNKWWPELESSVSEIMKKHEQESGEAIRSDRDLLEEVLALSRLAASFRRPDSHRRDSFAPAAVDDLVARFIDVVEYAQLAPFASSILERLELLSRPIRYIARRAVDDSPDLVESLDKLMMIEYSPVLSAGSKSAKDGAA